MLANRFVVVALLVAACSGASPKGAEHGSGDSSRNDADPFTVGELPGVPSGMRRMLDQISNRGLEIAQYETAAAKATDLLLAMNPDRSLLETFLARKNGSEWKVYFGKIVEEVPAFQVGYAFSCGGAACHPTAETGDEDLLSLARAVQIAQTAIEPKANKYNANVFREADRTISVYFTPGTTDPNKILIGGDYRVQVSPDGTTVIKSTPLHLSILEYNPSLPDGAVAVGTYITNILTNTPNETDVAFTLVYASLAPRLIVCKD